MPIEWLSRALNAVGRPPASAIRHVRKPQSAGDSNCTGTPAAEAIVDAISRWPEWVTRRVDSVQLLEGSRGRRKHSIDCVPPPDPGLAYDVAERSLEDINLLRGQLLVPLAFISKAPMRHLDVSQTDGTPMPVLGSEETCEVTISALVALLVKSGVPDSADLLQAMEDLVTSRGTSNLEAAQALIDTGSWNGVELWPSSVQLDAEVEAFVLNLSTDFVLIGLIPASQSGVRQVLKFSYHWTLNWSSSILENTLTAFRWTGSLIKLPMHMPAAAKSYHLEFQVPPELEIRELALPDSHRALPPVQSARDTSWSAVAHAHTSFARMPAEDATAILAIPRRGPWTSALATSLLTAIVFLLALILPGAMETLMEVGGNAAALLLAAPAVFIGLLAVQREHTFSSRLLDPLRVVITICAVLLFAMAGSVVGGLIQPWIMILWISGASFATLITLALLLGGRVDKMPREVK